MARSSPKDGGFLALADCVRDVDSVARYARTFSDAPAEAIYLHFRRSRAVGWRDLDARKRVAFEVFKATLAICDRLVVHDALAAPAMSARSYIAETITADDEDGSPFEVLQ